MSLDMALGDIFAAAKHLGRFRREADIVRAAVTETDL
jgi:hypothetical protein